MRKQGATGYTASDFQTTGVQLDMNGHFLKAQSAFVTSARIEGGQLIVKTTSVMTDNSDGCKLEVTPTFMEGSTDSQNDVGNVQPVHGSRNKCRGT